MTEQPNTTESPGSPAAQLLADIQRHVMGTLGNDYRFPREDTFYNGLAYSLRDRLARQWLQAQRTYYDQGAKRVYYLSMEFLPGRFMMSYITNLQLQETVEAALQGTGFTLEQLATQEWDAGLGNGGLGRLASCFMDSLATLRIPGYGYGIHYDYGLFFQNIKNGYQVELADNWVRQGNPWEIARRGFLYDVRFGGTTESWIDAEGRPRKRWRPAEKVKAMACDILVPGYGTDNVNNMRLWQAVSSEELDLDDFNRGEYLSAMEAKVLTENISKVLYPRDEQEAGRILRLRQQYFLVAATFQDILRRFKKRCKDFSRFPELVAVQLNDTHPTIAIPELMRLLVDEEGVEWDLAWEVCVRTFGYTNHTVLPEALECWPVDLLGRILPRHLEIIYDINLRFLQQVAARYPGNMEMLARLSLIEEGPVKKVRMAHLAIVGSHAVNGVAELHTRILRERIFPDFDRLFPARFQNVTNGITPRRWLLQANPPLARLISERIGTDWITDLNQLKRLIPLAEDAEFRQAWRAVRQQNKQRLAAYILRKTKVVVDPESLFDVQVKRIHEYKRQLLNVLHLIALYRRIKADPKIDSLPRTFIFAGKAAPGYVIAKLIIKLISAVAAVINGDPEVNQRLRAVFLPNYCVTQAERVIPAADLSEQISTAGMEASGTGNMKFALNGALTIGTLDGANIEIMEEVGEENIFIFGLRADEVANLRRFGYDPRARVAADGELAGVLDLIASNHFCLEEPGLFNPLLKNLLDHGDWFLLTADFRSYLEAQQRVERLYRDPEEWTRRSILNTANMGKFSSDRAIREYAERIWGVRPLAR